MRRKHLYTPYLCVLCMNGTHTLHGGTHGTGKRFHDMMQTESKRGKDHETVLCCRP